MKQQLVNVKSELLKQDNKLEQQKPNIFKKFNIDIQPQHKQYYEQTLAKSQLPLFQKYFNGSISCLWLFKGK